MLTLKEWFDAKSDVCKQYILDNTSWIDINQPDYVKRFGSTEEDLDIAAQKVIEDNSAVNYKLFIGTLLTVYKDKINNVQKYMDNIVTNYEYYSGSIQSYTGKERYREYRKNNSRQYEKQGLDYILLMTDDYSNIDWSNLNTADVFRNMPIYTELLGYQQIKELIKAENAPSIDMFNDSNTSDLFDELFFCEDGFTEQQKISLIDSFSPSISGVELFLKKIVSVDKYYLRYIFNIIKRYPALASYLYKEKKPDDEIDANSAIVEKYRYPKDLRKLFVIAGCCARKSLPKTKASSIGDVSSLLKFYNFDFDNIFDSLYS